MAWGLRACSGVESKVSGLGGPGAGGQKLEEEVVGWDPKQQRSGLGPQASGLSPSWAAGPAGAGCFGNRPMWPGTWGGCLEPGSLEISP